MIPDTSAQDRTVAAPKRRLPWPAIGATAGLVAVLVAVWAWAGADRSVSADRLRIATVERGLLVRDAQVNGRVVASVSPTLYAPAASTVNLRTRAGATVRKGDVLATLDSPELRAERDRELATLRGFEAVDDRLRELLQPFGVTLAGVYACPFHPVGSVPEFTQEHHWRKPAPGMLASAVAELDLDLAQSWAAGDKPRDVEAAVSAGIARERCFLLATSGEAGARCADLPAAVELILA